MRHTENEKITELSAALDALNRGDQPDSRDEEIKELAEVARLLKRTGPPPAVMTELVDTLGAELAARKRRRRLWLTSGTAGTAAAAMLVFALNMGPSTQPQPQLALPPSGSIVIESLPAPQPATESAPKVAKVDKAKEESVPAKRSEQAPQDTKPAPQVRGAAPPAQERPMAAADDSAQAAKRTMLAKVPEKAAERVADKPVQEQAAPEVAFLAWPGRQPDAVTVDKETSTVRQVYGRGDGEVIIIQRATSRAVATAPREGKATGFVAADGPTTFGAAKSKANRVTMTVKDTVVTVEGNQSEDELQEIARSLE